MLANSKGRPHEVRLASSDMRVLRPVESGAAKPPLRLLLRAATHDVHQRLHRHDGFAAIQNATIGLTAYRLLLIRLHGFYIPLEAAAAIGGHRSGWLRDDLRALDVDQETLDSTPICPFLPRLGSESRRLGALYVVEGSALGGQELGRGLDHLLGAGAPDGRRFFAGRGSATGEGWKRFLAVLSAASADPTATAEIVGAAVDTFAVFEKWLTGWSAVKHD